MVATDEHHDIDSRLNAMHSEVKELSRLYNIIKRSHFADNAFVRSHLQQKILALYREVQKLAKDFHITLPSA